MCVCVCRKGRFSIGGGTIAGHLPFAVDGQTACAAGRTGLHIVVVDVVVVSAIIVTVIYIKVAVVVVVNVM